MTAVLLVCVTVLCSSVSLSYGGSPVLCAEENTEYKCSNDCSEMCPTDPLTACTEECRYACFCQSGFSRENGKCVPTGKCDVKCREKHAIYTCVCEVTCDDIGCETCNYGCGCDYAFRRINGVCRPRAECYNCTLPEVYSDCNSPCTYNCPPPPDKPEGCAAVCLPGCGCQENYKRSRKTGICIPVEECEYQPQTT